MMEQDLFLFGETVGEAVARVAAAFDQVAGECRETLVLFGAGSLGRRTLNGLRRQGVEPLAFSDSNPKLWGQDVQGLPVLSPEEAAGRYGKTAVFVITIWHNEPNPCMTRIQAWLRALGCTRVLPFLPLFWKYHREFLPYYCLDLPQKLLERREQLRNLYHDWSDQFSREVYLSLLRWRCFADWSVLPSPVAGEQYFRDDLLVPLDNEVFVDCGAYNGDTLNSLIGSREGRFRKALAIEPDPFNFARLQRYVECLGEDLRRCIELLQCAVGRERAQVTYQPTGGVDSCLDNRGGHMVTVLPLDDLLTGLHPTFIKMDIEGWELPALEGGAEVIRRYRPVLAVSVYHRPEDLWQVPLTVQALASGYRFYLRPHSSEGWETVCYAVPQERARI